jgi:hypothetical protein
LPRSHEEGKLAPDERSRLELADAAKRAFGDDAGITLLELLPPVGWADVATKQDLVSIDQRLGRLEQRIDDVTREIRAQTWKLTTLMVAVVGVVVAAVRL